MTRKNAETASRRADHGNRQPSLGSPSPDEIAARAHDIYLARGATPGMELDDWLQAERELCFPGLLD